MPEPEIQLLRDLVIVREAPREETRDSGLYLPSTGEPPDWTWGEVLACGPDCSQTMVGDRVLFHRFKGTEVLGGVAQDPALAQHEDELLLIDLSHRCWSEPVTRYMATISKDGEERPVSRAGADEDAVRARLAEEYPGWEVKSLEPAFARAGEAAALAGLRDEVDAATDPLG